MSSAKSGEKKTGYMLKQWSSPLLQQNKVTQDGTEGNQTVFSLSLQIGRTEGNQTVLNKPRVFTTSHAEHEASLVSLKDSPYKTVRGSQKAICRNDTSHKGPVCLPLY